jgi:hypothetical protein
VPGVFNPANTFRQPGGRFQKLNKQPQMNFDILETTFSTGFYRNIGIHPNLCVDKKCITLQPIKLESPCL